MTEIIDWICEVCEHGWESVDSPEPTECPECGAGPEAIKKKIPGLHDDDLKVRP